MIITLLVLTILVIIVTSVVLVVQKDVQQRTNTELYERYYDNAENKVLNSINTFGSTRTANLTTVATEGQTNCSQFAGTSCSCLLSGVDVICTYTDNTNKTAVKLKITDQKDLQDFPLLKDQFFQMKLSGYKETIIASWTGSTSMSISINYRVGGPSGQYKSIHDVYDSANLFGSGSNPSHSVTFTPLAGKQGFQFNLATDVAGIGATDYIVGIDFRPLISKQGDQTLLSVQTTSTLILPQVRVFEATGYGSDTTTTFGESPAPSAITQIPLYPAMPSIFDYVLLTQGSVRN
jgi:hypothetical protein